MASEDLFGEDFSEDIISELEQDIVEQEEAAKEDEDETEEVGEETALPTNTEENQGTLICQIEIECLKTYSLHTFS